MKWDDRGRPGEERPRVSSDDDGSIVPLGVLSALPIAHVPQYPHGRECTDECKRLAVPSPWCRVKPPQTRCPHCEAGPGESCVVRRPGRWITLPHGHEHPSRPRQEVAA